MGPTGTTRVVQIHPTRRCNLRCMHCYSSSSPDAIESLPAALLKDALDELSAEGYNWASFSGGEPLVYKPLPELLAHARQVGMQTAVVSNGMLLTPHRLDSIEPFVDLLVISLDGKPASHNRVRNHAGAFDTMSAKLPELQARGIDFGFLFTLTQYNLDELPWVVEFAANVGAKLLQIHPLEDFGNAARQLAGEVPDAIEGAHAWLLADKFRELLGGRMALQVDLVHSGALQRQPDSFYLGDFDAQLDRPLGEQLSPLVVEPDGAVLPLQYGFSRDYALGNLYRDGIVEVSSAWREHVGPRMHALSRSLHDSLAGEPPGFFNWYERLAGQAQSQRPPTVQGVPLSTLDGSGART
jgi:MoaA/NifB/PqqE/SkfB family radical SAM enzyme